MATRKPLGNKLRFEIFKRDKFTCVYCGNTPPKVVLEIDHVMPHAKGGSNKIENLVTSCFECNRGKRDNDLNYVPNTISVDKDRLLQYKEYINYIKELTELDIESVNMVCDIYELHFEGFTPNDNFRNAISNFIKKIGLNKTIDAMKISCSRMAYKEHQLFKYFCGTCWSMYRESQNNIN